MEDDTETARKLSNIDLNLPKIVQKRKAQNY